MAVRDAAQVERMFDSIARRYDLLNTVLSGGADARWRRLTAERALAGGAAGRVLDVACGSGKLALALHRRSGAARVVGLDFSSGMLAVARRESPGPVYTRGDGLALPFEDGTFDAATIAFGLRNFADPVLGLREMRRVVRPGGTLAVLEFVRPSTSLVGRAYRLYLLGILPRVGGWVSGQPRAYRYLGDTVDGYHSPGELLALAGSSGWSHAGLRLLTLGTVGLLTARS